MFSRSYCWIHGTAYVRKHLQGTGTGCFVDQSRIHSEEDAPVTAYYLWLPYLLTFCIIFAKLPHSMWKSFFENGMMKKILGSSQGNNSAQFPQGGGGGGAVGGNESGSGGCKGKSFANVNTSRSSDIAQNFYDFRSAYNEYQRKFLIWESSNILTVIISWFLTHWLLNNKFKIYGTKVLYFLGS